MKARLLSTSLVLFWTCAAFGQQVEDRPVVADPNCGQRETADAGNDDDDKAIVDLTEAIRLDPQNSELYLQRGSIWQQKRENDHAIADYSKAIRLNPTEAKAYL